MKWRCLNKGESLHALRRDTEQAWCLTLVTNAVIAWTTEYYGPTGYRSLRVRATVF